MSKELGNGGILFATKLDFTLIIEHLKSNVMKDCDNEIVYEGLKWTIRLFEDGNTFFEYYFNPGAGDGTQILYGTDWKAFKTKIDIVEQIEVHITFDISFNITKLVIYVTGRDDSKRKQYNDYVHFTGDYEYANKTCFGNDRYHVKIKKRSGGFKTKIT